MTNKTKDLVAAGHALAKELHCAESAALVRELATQLDVQLARSNALVAENAALKECNTDIMKHVYRSKTYLDSSRVVDAIQGLQCAIERKSGKTPAADAFLAEVRASAVEEFVRMADYSESVADGEVIVTSNSVFSAGHVYADQIRKGVRS